MDRTFEKLFSICTTGGGTTTRFASQLDFRVEAVAEVAKISETSSSGRNSWRVPLHQNEAETLGEFRYMKTELKRNIREV